MNIANAWISFIKRKHILFLIVLFFYVANSFAQDNIKIQQVLLKNGNSIIATKIEYIDDYLLITTNKGELFQIGQTEIERIRILSEQTSESSHRLKNRASFGTLAFIEGGYLNASNTKQGGMISNDLGFAIGLSDIGNGIEFVGIGTGYSTAIHKVATKNLIYVPLFATAIISIGEAKTTPFIASSAGYAFRTKGNYEGGGFIQLKTGVKLNINKQSNLLIGLFGKIASISGTVIEHNEFGEFQRRGETKALSSGLNFTVMF